MIPHSFSILKDEFSWILIRRCCRAPSSWISSLYWNTEAKYSHIVGNIGGVFIVDVFFSSLVIYLPLFSLYWLSLSGTLPQRVRPNKISTPRYPPTRVPATPSSGYPHWSLLLTLYSPTSTLPSSSRRMTSQCGCIACVCVCVCWGALRVFVKRGSTCVYALLLNIYHTVDRHCCGGLFCRFAKRRVLCFME